MGRTSQPTPVCAFQDFDEGRSCVNRVIHSVDDFVPNLDYRVECNGRLGQCLLFRPLPANLIQNRETIQMHPWFLLQVAFRGSPIPLRSPLVRLGTFVVDRIGKKPDFWSGFLPSDLSYFGTSRPMCSAAA